MSVPVTLIGILAAIVANSRIIRSRKPGARTEGK
jgi:hypothetical protein